MGVFIVYIIIFLSCFNWICFSEDFLLKIYNSSNILEEYPLCMNTVCFFRHTHNVRKGSGSWKFVVTTSMHRRKGEKKGYYIFELEPRAKEYVSFPGLSIKLHLRNQSFSC